MKWIVDHAVSIAFFRAVFVTVAIILSFVYPEHSKSYYAFILICLITIPSVEIARKRVK